MVINKDIFRTEFIVRDYECDLQGIVNNANYQHYFEHARHQFLISQGISFANLHEEGIDLIVVRVEIDYKYPLRSMDRFYVTATVERDGNVRLTFRQEIRRSEDNKLVARGKITGVATQKGRPVRPPRDILEKTGLI